MENKKYNIQEMNKLYKEIVDNKRLSFEQKKNALKILLSKIEKYNCYENGETNCPYSIYLCEEAEIVEFVCDYLNMNGYCNSKDTVRIARCPITKLENEINKYINNSYFNVLAIPKNQVCIIRTRTDNKGNKIDLIDVCNLNDPLRLKKLDNKKDVPFVKQIKLEQK